MTIYAFEAQESWLPTVIGMSCFAVAFDLDTATLTLAFNPVPDHEPMRSADEPERSISLAGVWRVEQEDVVLAASGDLNDTERAGHLDRLVGRELIRADVSHPGYELALHLTGPYVVRSFPCDTFQFGEHPADDAAFVAWWVDGLGIPTDWEEPNAAYFDLSN